MQRIATKQSRGANAQEKAFLRWIKERGICAACGNDGGVICHHVVGSAAKISVGLERVHYGHWFVLGLCQKCDDVATNEGRTAFRELYGKECNLWFDQIGYYGHPPSGLIFEAIIKYGK